LDLGATLPQVGSRVTENLHYCTGEWERLTGRHNLEIACQEADCS
jgi:hypothetical protein